MLIPTQFKATISKTFYDKTFTVATRTQTVDAEGGVVITAGTPRTLKGNVQYSLNERLREIYGISEQVDLAVTTDQTVDKNDQLTYEGKDYVVTSFRKSDSHNLIVARSL